MKKLFLATIALAIGVLAFTGCGTNNAPKQTPEVKVETGTEAKTEEKNEDETAKEPSEIKTITIGASSNPHAVLLELVVDDLKEEGIDLVVKEFPDWTLLNKATVEGEIAANYFQTVPYLEDYNSKSGDNLVSVADIHIEPLGIYSRKVKSLDELKDGAVVAIPNDPANAGRALHLLANNGVIKLKDGIGLIATTVDIIENPKNIVISEQEASFIPRALDDVDLAVINGNYALEAKLNPSVDALALESKENNPYANIIVTTEENKDNEELKKVIDALRSQKVKDYIESTYNGVVIPAF